MAAIAMPFGPVSFKLAHSRPEPYTAGTPSLGGAEASEACQFFVKTGWCKWGDGCRHAHIPGPDTPTGGRPGGPPGEKTGEVCQFFSKSGWCKYGDRCKHQHIAGLSKGAPPDPSEPCKFFAKAGRCQFGDSCRYLHVAGPETGKGGFGPGQSGQVPQDATRSASEPCQFFAKAGWCKYGAACRFVHALSPDSQPQPATKSRELCQFFSKSGWCKYGDQCKHEHVGGPPAPDQPGTEPAETCKFFARAGWCQFGDSCRYQHADIAGPGMRMGMAPGASLGHPGPCLPRRELSAAEAEAAAAALISSPGMQRAESIGLQLSDEAVKALLTIPCSHASELLETVSEKHTTLRDPSNYVISTIAKGYVPRGPQ